MALPSKLYVDFIVILFEGGGCDAIDTRDLRFESHPHQMYLSLEISFTNENREAKCQERDWE